MECKMSLVCALDMAHSPYSGPKGLKPGKCENSFRCTPQQVHVWSVHSSDVSHVLRAS